MDVVGVPIEEHDPHSGDAVRHLEKSVRRAIMLVVVT